MAELSCEGGGVGGGVSKGADPCQTHLNVLQDLGVLACIDQRSHPRAFVQGVADLDALGSLLQKLVKLWSNLLV